MMAEQTLRTDAHPEIDHDVVVIGAGITGIYMLYCLRKAGFSVRLVDAARGVGGVWCWNRYPMCRFDSQSYVYGYLFSKELFDEWQWSEHFAGQPEIEAYLNFVVDKLGMRDDIQLNTPVEGAEFDPRANRWTVATAQGERIRARYVIAATGLLSIPFIPDIPGKDGFEGEMYHTGRWPEASVDFTGKRVAVIGTGSSAVQLIPAIIKDVASLTVYQRTPNWCLPLNNSPITPEEAERIRGKWEEFRKTCQSTFSGFHYPDGNRLTFDDDEAQREAFYEDMWTRPGFEKVFSNYADLIPSKEANDEFCKFIASKIRSIVHDPDTAEKLIPKDHRLFQKRPPMVTGYYEAFNEPNIELVDARSTPITRITNTAIETAAGSNTVDMIVWGTGFDPIVGSLFKMQIESGEGTNLRDFWGEGPVTYVGIQPPKFPNFFFVGGPHTGFGNVPRVTEVQVDFIAGLLQHMREMGFDRVEPEMSAAEAWGEHVNECATQFEVAEGSWFTGANIPGRKPSHLLYYGGLKNYRTKLMDVAARGYAGFTMSGAENTVQVNAAHN